MKSDRSEERRKQAPFVFGALALGGLLIFLLARGEHPVSKAETKPAPGAGASAPKIIPLTNMVSIKAGSFVRGTNLITISRDYWLGKFEVTQGEFESVMGANTSHFAGDANRPVERVKQTDAAAYCAAITRREKEAGRLAEGFVYRLPTEAEWEYACRAGLTNLFSFGDETALADQYAWTMENADGKTHPVGQKKPNPWGLYDMHGNVWEWCSDWFEPFPKADLTDPVGPPASKFKVFRGGSWNHAVEFARSNNRFMMAAEQGIHFVGFRVALGRELAPGGAAQGAR